MENLKLDADVLLNIGFVDIGRWMPKGDAITYQLDGENASANEALLDSKNALYAFVKGHDVHYIGKTSRSIRKRYVGYCRPGQRQATNRRCHNNIKMAIADDYDIRIFVFVPITHLRYSDFEINLAAGLEDELIRQFNPLWNGKNKGQPISESAEREEAEIVQTDADAGGTKDIPPAPKASLSAAPVPFTVHLGPTYYKNGFLNPGVEASRFLGKNGEMIQVLLGDASNTVDSKINRTANRTGAVRVVGGNQQIARWFQENFEQGDTVQGEVLGPYEIQLLSD